MTTTTWVSNPSALVALAGDFARALGGRMARTAKLETTLFTKGSIDRLFLLETAIIAGWPGGCGLPRHELRCDPQRRRDPAGAAFDAEGELLLEQTFGLGEDSNAGRPNIMFEVAEFPGRLGHNDLRPCRLYLIEAADGPGPLLRVLGMFSVRQALVRCVRAETLQGTAHIRVEAVGLDAGQAAALANKLQERGKKACPPHILVHPQGSCGPRGSESWSGGAIESGSRPFLGGGGPSDPRVKSPRMTRKNRGVLCRAITIRLFPPHRAPPATPQCQSAPAARASSAASPGLVRRVHIRPLRQQQLGDRRVPVHRRPVQGCALVQIVLVPGHVRIVGQQGLGAAEVAGFRGAVDADRAGARVPGRRIAEEVGQVGEAPCPFRSARLMVAARPTFPWGLASPRWASSASATNTCDRRPPRLVQGVPLGAPPTVASAPWASSPTPSPRRARAGRPDAGGDPRSLSLARALAPRAQQSLPPTAPTWPAAAA